MELRLTLVRDTEERTVIHVDGRLAREGVRQLEEACRGNRPGTLALDLAHLLTLDDAGVATLRRLAEDGAELKNASPYVKLLLQGSNAGGTESRSGHRGPRGEKR